MGWAMYRVAIDGTLVCLEIELVYERFDAVPVIGFDGGNN